MSGLGLSCVVVSSGENNKGRMSSFVVSSGGMSNVVSRSVTVSSIGITSSSVVVTKLGMKSFIMRIF